MRHIIAGIVLLLGLGGAAFAQQNPVVVELFTSQGCSSCPPADAMMHDLVARDDVIALAFHVDYWDYIGWRDSFGSPENSARQNGYAMAAGSRTIYTPQFVIAGQDYVTGARGMELADQIAAHRGAQTGVSVTLVRDGAELSVALTAEAPAAMIVQLVRFVPAESVEILRGENAGQTLTYANTVRALDVIARWDGTAPLNLSVEMAGEMPAVVLVQAEEFGPILAAAQVE